MSPIPAELLVRSVRFPEITFESLESTRGKTTETLTGNKLEFSEGATLKIQPNQTEDFLISLKSIKPELLTEFFEVLVNQSLENDLYFQVLANI